MVNESSSQENQKGPPPLDEGWWMALLEEEKRNAPLPSEAQPAVLQATTPTEKPPEAEAGQSISLESTLDWEQIYAIYRNDEIVNMIASGYNRGGLLVDGNGLRGFVPLSHLVNLPDMKSSKKRERLLAGYVGRTLTLKVIECLPEEERLILSERAALSEPGRRLKLLRSLETGKRVWGTVSNITNFGAFVDLDGLEGLVHVSEISWGRVRHPADVLRLGEQIEVYILSVDEERSRVALSIKRLDPNPWDNVDSRYHPGEVVEATITSVLPFGAFARVEEGLDGLIHVSEMGSPDETIKAADILHNGQQVKARIVYIDATRQRLGLSLRL